MESTLLAPIGHLPHRRGLRALALENSLLVVGLALVVLIGSLGSQMAVSFHPSARLAGLDLAPAHLPHHAAGSTSSAMRWSGLSIDPDASTRT